MRSVGLEPTRISPADLKSAKATNYIMSASHVDFSTPYPLEQSLSCLIKINSAPMNEN